MTADQGGQKNHNGKMIAVFVLHSFLLVEDPSIPMVDRERTYLLY